MDMYTSFWLLMGTLLGFCIGFGVHAMYMRRFLKKHMSDHPEYKMYLDLIRDDMPDKKDKGGDK